MRTRLVARLVAATLAAALATTIAPAPPAALADDALHQVVQAVGFEAGPVLGDRGEEASGARPATRAMTGWAGNLRPGGLAPSRPAAGRPDPGTTTLGSRPAVSPSLMQPGEGASAMSYANSYSPDEYGPQATTAVLGSRMVVAQRDHLRFYRMPPAEMIDYTHPAGFFGIPGSEWYWTPSVAASIRNDRFVAVLPSFQGQAKDCARGYLTVAVSRSSNPMGSWYRYRIAMPDGWTDEVSIGLSDNKVVLSVNQFDLRAAEPDCLGGAWEGGRLWVMDWADLLDGGTLAVREVSPTPRTDYWSWVPAVNVPGTANTSGGNTVRLVGDRYVSTWGHLAYATVTGSARAGTAKLVGNADLTAARDVDLLVGPPERILAMASGNGGLDERVLSAVARGSRLYLTTHGQCRYAEDTDYRSCARIIELDTSTALPTLVQDVMYVELAADTFLPFVGVARDGTVFLVMARSSAVELLPTDHYVVYREAGERFDMPPFEVLFHRGEARPEANTGHAGSVVPDPVNTHRVWAQYDDGREFGPSSQVTAFVGNLTGDPGGTMRVGNGTGWGWHPFTTITLQPSASSPIMWVRWSGSPEVTETEDGPMLTTGEEGPSTPSIGADFTSPEIGGTPADPFPVHVQWRTGDGRWSAPIAATVNLDSVPPTVPVPTWSFATGKASSAIPLRLSWQPVTDDESGVATLRVYRLEGGGWYGVRALAPTATETAVSAYPGAPTAFQLEAWDVAGTFGSAQTETFTVRVADDRSKAVAYSSGWTSASSSRFLSGTARSATRAGRTATFTFTGRSAAFVTTKGPNRGKAEVWVDGVKVATLDLYRASTAYRQLVWHTSWPDAGSHTVRIRVLGTPGRPRVDIDAFVRG